MVLIMNYYIYLDDVREDDTWFRQNQNLLEHLSIGNWIPYVVRSYEEAIHILEHLHHDMLGNDTLIIDLDHDLGETEDGYNELARTGYDVCKWIIERNFHHLYFHIHSMNPVGATNMRQLLTHYGYKEI